MDKSSSNGFSYAATVLVLLSSLVLIGCPKKVEPTGSASGISREKGSETPAQEEGARPPASPREESARGERTPQSEEKLPPMAKSEPEQRRELPEGSAPDPNPGPLQDVFFEFDQWVLAPDAKAVLERNVQWLEANPQARIQIEGHSDERGTDEYNLALGERRAKSAMNFLANLGVNPSRISIISFGEEKGFCDGKDEACYQKNRRAHFIVQ